ncbi:MAG TPA: Rne/Rng family ribonuclease [Polyangiaceae bacterium]|jgi:ribonuclease G|nr:Rne/Rng family ribonuclease [Polyangiaceae bacterium]
MPAKNLLVISVDIRETRVALIEDGIIAELHIERRGSGSQPSTVGNVYLGRVTRVLPGLQAAFIDIGQERAAFLHVEDLIRPADFDAYLQGTRKQARDEDVAGPEVTGNEELDTETEQEIEAAPPPAVASGESLSAADAQVVTEAEADTASPEDEAADDEGSNGVSAESAADVVARAEDEADAEEETAAAVAADDDEDEESDGEPDTDTEAETAEAAAEAEDADLEAVKTTGAATVTETGDDDFGDLPGFTVSDPGEPVPRAAQPRERERGGGGGGGGGRGRGRGRARGRGRGGRDRDHNDRGGGDRGKKRQAPSPLRISKSTPIREVVKEGQDIIVQVSKDPIGTKGARCTSHVSLPGRYVVYVPTVEHVGISKRIGSDSERARLREAIDAMKPPTGGLIVRTVAEGLTKKQLKADVGYLVRLWGEIAKKKQETTRAPAVLMSELDLVLKTARDLFTDEVDQIVIDDKQQYERLVRFVEMFAPDRVKDIEFYQGDEPIFDEYGIEDEIGRALSRKVPLPSGGYLIIDQAEALTAIDVNTGRFVGKGSKDMEETILKTNLEAVHEIAYQLRFRNIGGLIILDLIDMEKANHREKVRRTLDDLLQKDKAKTTLNRISELGLIEMTRKRTRESLGRMLHEPCFYCDGTGQLQSKETIAYEILREIRRRRRDLPGYTIIVNAHPAVADLLTGPEKEALAVAENKYMRKIMVQPRKEYHLEQFDLQGK